MFLLPCLIQLIHATAWRAGGKHKTTHLPEAFTHCCSALVKLCQKTTRKKSQECKGYNLLILFIYFASVLPSKYHLIRFFCHLSPNLCGEIPLTALLLEKLRCQQHHRSTISQNLICSELEEDVMLIYFLCLQVINLQEVKTAFYP